MFVWSFVIACPNIQCNGYSGIQIPLKEVPLNQQFGHFAVRWFVCSLFWDSNMIISSLLT
jgi:hypothetical protein